MSTRKSFAFAGRHPWVLLLYFVGMIGVTVLTMHPLVIGISLGIGLFYDCSMRGGKAIREAAAIAVPLFVFACVIQPLFSHNGVTPLFYLNGQAVTWETVCFGLVMGGLLEAVYIWFSVWNAWITNDKFLYLFHWPFAKAALFLSMVLRAVPLLGERFARIDEAWCGMGRDYRTEKFPANVKMLAAEISVLLSWSLEGSLDTSDSMEARGYGVGRRTAFHLFCFRKRDGIWFGILLVCFSICTALMAKGVYRIYYFPKIVLEKFSALSVAGLVLFVVAGLVPLMCQWTERMEYHDDASM